jgi:hypothetical protein
MKRSPTANTGPRFLRAPRSRGQTMILGAVALLVLALVVFITFNVTVAVQQKIKLQNYADTKAFSMAVAEARALNYMAYTNRAIASGYVGMANLHAYVSEAAILADLKLATIAIMGKIVDQEKNLCNCCLGAPCCLDHCWHATEAGLNIIGLIPDTFGKMGGLLRQLDAPASDAMSALNSHVSALHATQTQVREDVRGMLNGGTFGTLKEGNMQKAADFTTDNDAVNAANVANWEKVFQSNADIKKKILAETVNATRQDFAWNRKGADLDNLFKRDWLAQNVKGSFWMGPDGDWNITQMGDFGLVAGGRTAFLEGDFDGGFIGAMGKDATPGGVRGQVVGSFDWGTLNGAWRHGSHKVPLPLSGMLFTPKLLTGTSGNKHTAGSIADFLNNPHGGGNHSLDIDMTRFMEFDIGTSYPFNQPAVYAAVETDSRVNEYGKRGPWEVAKDQSGTVKVDNTGSQTARLTLSNNQSTKAFSKAMVYYHRIGDWSDYPNLFNPYWRAKLDPLSETELGVLNQFDSNASSVATSSKTINSGAVNVQ